MENINNIVCNLSKTFYNQEGQIIFDPPLYIQRYNAAISCLNHQFFRDKIQHIVEFGCAEMKLFAFIKCALINRDLKIKLVDIDEELLMRCRNSIQPLIMDHVKRREHHLNVEMWQGDVSINNPNFTDVDAVIAIELIEHVYPNVLNEIPYQIFENLKPKIAIFSTPNCEYNEIFSLEPGKFRHDDHKFEWTRQQFNDWCDNICERFKDYSVKIEGIGVPPDGLDINKLGYSSQFAIFVRKDFIESLQEPFDFQEPEEQIELPMRDLIPCEGYKLLSTIEYPVFKDTRSEMEKINDEICYHVNRMKFMDNNYNEETDKIEIPINSIVRLCWEVTSNEETIEAAIRQRFEVKDDMIIMEGNDYDESDYRQNDFESEGDN